MANILVTGGAGFIGSHLCEELVQQNHKVICFDNLSTGNIKNITHLPRKKFVYVNGNINNWHALKNLFGNPIDYVYHYAACVGVKKTNESPLSVFQDTYGIRNICEACRKYDVKKLVFASSSEVYGEQNGKLKETNLTRLEKPYSIVKLLGEQYLKTYSELYKFDTCSLRIFNTYGPRQRSDSYGFVTGIFISQALSNTGPTIYGDGKQTRDFIYIKDNAKIAAEALANKKAVGSINIASGKTTTIKKLAELIIRLCGKKTKPKYLASLKEDITHRCADVTKMKKVFDYKPVYNLERGLAETIRWFKKFA